MSDNEGVKRAKRATAYIVAEFPFPATYDDLHDLLGLAYLRGSMDELQHVIQRTDEEKEKLLTVLDGGAVA